MLFVWLAVFLSTISWLYSLCIYTDPVPPVGWMLIGGAVLSAYLGFLRRSFSASSKKYIYLIPPLLFASLVLPLPYGIAPALMVLGLLLFLWGRTRSFGSAVLLVAFILTVQSLVPAVYGIITARSPTASSLSPVVYWVLRFLKTPISYSQDTLFFRSMKELYEIQTTWAAVGLLPVLLIVAGGTTAMLLHQRSLWRSLVRLLVSCGVYALARYILLILIFLYLMYFTGYEEETSKVYIFWNPIWIGVSFLPLIFVVNRLFRPKMDTDSDTGSNQASLGRRRKIFVASFSLAAFFLTGVFGFQDPGRMKKGRVLIDEGHSEWTVTTKPYDTSWYGAESGYNYFCMAEYVGRHYQLTRNLSPITRELLESCDVLILKIPTEPYSEEEIDAIVDFVQSGGGLFLIGDHTNVFGSSTYLNRVAKRFGFRFRYDCLFDIEDVFTQVYERPRILPHPIVQRMPPFLFAVSCSIEPESFFPGRLILAGGLKRLEIDYSVSNFYPHVRDKLGMWFGNFHQAVATRHGKGRVVGFTDSTVYSNFSAFYPGKPEFLLSTIDWLNRSNLFSWVNRLLLGLAVCCLLGAARIFPGKTKDSVGLSLCTSALCFLVVSAGVMLFGAMNRKVYGAPQPISEITSVVFEQGHCDYDLPLTGFLDDPARGYEIFYQWILRLGFYPFIVDDVSEGVDNADIMVFINPISGFNDGEIVALDEFVAHGGRILVADMAGNRSESSDQLLTRFGIRASKARVVDASRAYEPVSQLRWNLGEAFHLDGGTPLLYTEEAFVVSAFAEHGQGYVLALSFSPVFNDANMGFTEGVIPDADLLHRYHLQFALIKGLADGSLREALANADNL